jgi:signal transduction histidine kinase
MPIASVAFDLRRTLSEVRDAMRPIAEKSGGAVELDLGEAVGAMESDEARLRQILLGLIGNLCLRPKHGRIRVRAERERDEDGTWIRFEVSDQGGGLEGSVLDQLFEPFSPAGRSRAPDASELGPGLGLAMIKCLSQALGGELTVRSDGGRGAKFTLRLPARIASSNTTADFMFPVSEELEKTDKMPTAADTIS